MKTKKKIPDDVLIDEEDREILESMGKWYCKSDGYCVRSHKINGKTKKLYMHRIITKCPDHLFVDHINHNRKDNRKCNLRIVTQQENRFNIKDTKGYMWHKQAKKWRSRIKLNGKQLSLGCFDTEEEARNAYLEAKKKYHKIPERKENATDSSDV